MMIVVERNDVHFTKLPVIVSVTLLILSENILSIDNYASFSSLQLYEWSDVGKACNCIQFIFPRFHSGLVPINSDTFPLYGHFRRRLQFKVTKCDQTGRSMEPTVCPVSCSCSRSVHPRKIKLINTNTSSAYRKYLQGMRGKEEDGERNLIIILRANKSWSWPSVEKLEWFNNATPVLSSPPLFDRKRYLYACTPMWHNHVGCSKENINICQ